MTGFCISITCTLLTFYVKLCGCCVEKRERSLVDVLIFVPFCHDDQVIENQQCALAWFAFMAVCAIQLKDTGLHDEIALWIDKVLRESKKEEANVICIHNRYKHMQRMEKGREEEEKA